ncbi:hypothetical protein, partial [Streptomyces sp. SID3343]|uniref:hypothetical protein n=1 Tax=Streptomyces sp. SID3343 TaxID=2690260 RepID=UPI001370D38F
MAAGRNGHHVAVLAPPRRRPASGYPRCVAEVHEVPPFAADPWAWLTQAETVVGRESYDVLLPTHDQVAVLAREPTRITNHATGLAVPPFAALRRIADRGAAAGTLTELAMPQPAGTVVVHDAESLRQVADPPLYVKTLLGTHRIDRREQLLLLADELERAGLFLDGAGVLVQEPAEGQAVSAQAVFERGRLVAIHAYARVSGAAVKRSVVVPEIREHVAMLGGHLGWHGGLSLDAILTPKAGPVWIDVRPYLAEPANAAASGTDLVGALIAVASGDSPASMPWGRADVRTRRGGHAVRTAARAGRWAALRELARLTLRSQPYQATAEEAPT